MRDRLYSMAELCDIAYVKDDLCRRGLFSNLGYAPLAWFDKGGAQAALLLRNGVYFLVFRGTDEAGDWLKDADIRKVKTRFGYVHRGFEKGVDAIWGDLVLKLQSTGGLRKRFVICGHSKGAGEATLAACRLQARRYDRVVGVYLFGSPRVGGYSFKYPKAPTYRVVNNNDIVCRVPSMLRFRHVGQRYYLDHRGKLIKGVTAWQITKDRISGRWAARNLIDGLADHPIQQYVKQLRG